MLSKLAGLWLSPSSCFSLGGLDSCLTLQLEEELRSVF